MNKNDLLQIYGNPQPIPSLYNEGWSQYETVKHLIAQINILINNQNIGADEISDLQNKKVYLEYYLDDLKNNRKLDENGDFTGTLNGLPMSFSNEGLATDINNAKGVFQTLTAKLLDFDNKQNLHTEQISEITTKQGDINQLNTQNKSSIVDAIKEVKSQGDSNVLAISNNTQAIQSLGSGSPKGVYATLSALTSAFPSGNTNTYVVTADGKWYYWSGSVWTVGGTYQGTGIAPKSIGDTEIKLNNTLSTVDDVITKVTGRTVLNRTLMSSDFTPIRGTFTVDVSGNLTVTKDLAAFTSAILTNTDEMEFLSRLGYYTLFAEHNGVAYGFDIIQKKIYEFKNNYTTLGNLIATLSYSSVTLGDKVHLQIVDGELVAKKNGADWFKIDKTTVEANLLGVLIPTGVVDGSVVFNNGYIYTKKTKLSYDEQIQDIIDSKSSITKWGLVGDSITALTGVVNSVDYGTNWSILVKNILGIPTLNNIAIGGSRIAYKNTGDSVYDPMAMVRRYTTLASDCDLITVMGGTNDFAGSNLDGVPMGVKGSTLESEFYGALKILIEGLITKFPTKKIAFMLPLKNNRESATNKNLQGYTLQDYRNAIIDMCNDYAIPYYETHKNSMISSYTFNSLTTDGIHPNKNGHEMIANKIANFIKGL